MLNFKAIRDTDIRLLQSYVGLRSNPSCDCTLFDTLLFDRVYQGQCAVTEKALFFCYHEEHTICGGTPLCRAEDLPAAMEELRDYFHHTLGLELTMTYVDEVSKELLAPLYPAAVWEEMPDYADYIYDAEALRSLSGKKYHKKKNHVNSFLKTYEGRFEYVPLTGADAPEIREFLIRWAKSRDTVEEELQWELDGLEDIFGVLDLLKAHCGGIRVDGRLEAMSMGTYNEADQMAVIHVEKANTEIGGLYSYINQAFLQQEFPEAVYVNREDDAGEPALRKAKESYHPLRMARKWSVRGL